MKTHGRTWNPVKWKLRLAALMTDDLLACVGWTFVTELPVGPEGRGGNLLDTAGSAKSAQH